MGKETDEATRLRGLLKQIACQTDPRWSRRVARLELGMADEEPPPPVAGYCWSCGATPRYQHKPTCRAKGLRSVPSGA